MNIKIKLVLLLLIVFICRSANSQQHLVTDSFEVECNFFDDMPKGSCDNPDIWLEVPQIIRRHGYPSESHVVETEDGYLLTLHRIPGDKSGNRGGQPVFLQHGLLGSSIDWLVNGDESIGFAMADAGYDVWLGNARGNFYSKGHISLSIKSAAYWNFSWHEMGTYDLPAVINHVANYTNKPGEIIYIGHSMGTTMFFVFSSTRLQAAKNIKLMIALAPTAYMTHIRNPIKYISPLSKDINWVIKYLGIHQFLPRGKALEILTYECEVLQRHKKKFCENMLVILLGIDKGDINMTALPLLLSHDPAGTSTKTVLHYSQEINNKGEFQYYDFGPKENLVKYNSSTPPKYNPKNIKRPIYLMYGEADTLASPIDVLRLSHKLSNLVGVYRMPRDSFDHCDFIVGKHAPELVNPQMLKIMQNYKEGVVTS